MVDGADPSPRSSHSHADVVNGHHEALQVSDRVLALPGQKFVVHGVEHYASGDVGQVSTADSEKFYITWERTGLTSKHRCGVWQKYFERVLEVDDRVISSIGGELGKLGDSGVVVAKDEHMYYVVWDSSAARVGVPKGTWRSRCERVRHLQAGDVVMVLPGQSLEHGGRDVYRQGDLGDVVKAEADKLQIEWRRTGEASSLRPDKWQKVLKRWGLARARLQVFDFLDQDRSGTVTRSEWASAFVRMDTNGDDILTRKEWQLLDERTEIFDLLPRKYRSQVSRHEWEEAFVLLDKDGIGRVTTDQWSLENLSAVWACGRVGGEQIGSTKSNVSRIPSKVGGVYQTRLSLAAKGRASLDGAEKGSRASLAADGNAVFDALDGDGRGTISLQEWREAFSTMDADHNGIVTRKEWNLRHGEMYVFDAVPKRYANQISQREWEVAFKSLDTDRDDEIIVEEWRKANFSDESKGSSKVGSVGKKVQRELPTCSHEEEAWDEFEGMDYIDYENNVDLDAMPCSTEAELAAVKLRVMQEALSGFSICRGIACLKRSPTPLKWEDLSARADGVRNLFYLPCPGCCLKARDCKHDKDNWESHEGVDFLDKDSDVEARVCNTDEELRAAQAHVVKMGYAGFSVHGGFAHFKSPGRPITREDFVPTSGDATVKFFWRCPGCYVRSEAGRLGVETEVIRMCHAVVSSEATLKANLADYSLPHERKREVARELQKIVPVVAAYARLRRVAYAAVVGARRPNLDADVVKLQEELLGMLFGPEEVKQLPYWEPYIGRVQRPVWLPACGTGNGYVKPAEWGMTLRQWSAFIKACLFGEGGAVEHANFYHIIDGCVKPWTNGIGTSVALLLNNRKPLKPDLMISHAWGETALETLCAVLARCFALGYSLDTVVWCAAFAMYQPGDQRGDCGPTLADQQQMDPVRRIIESKPSYGMLVVNTSRNEYFKRLWCLFEMKEFLAAERSLIATPSLHYILSNHVPRSQGGREGIRRVDLTKAVCSKRDEERDLRRRVESHQGGAQALNERIHGFRLESLDEMRVAAESFSHWAENSQAILGEKDLLLGLTTRARCAASFVALHCLTRECASAGDVDKAYQNRIVQEARKTIKPMLLPGEAATHVPAVARTPPFFDVQRRCADMAQMQKLLDEDDDELMLCLASLGRFPLPVGYLEMCTGGHVVRRARDIDDFEGKDRAACNSFHCSLDRVPENMQMAFTFTAPASHTPTRCFVEIIGAHSLRAADTCGTSDPYCIMEIAGHPETRTKTRHVSRTLEPEWNESFEIRGYRLKDVLQFTVMDHDTVSRDDFLGVAKLSGDVLQNGFFDGQLDLADDGKHGHWGNRTKGWIAVRVFISDGVDELPKQTPRTAVRGTLMRCYVDVVRAEGLRAMDLLGSSDPYCVVGVVDKPHTRKRTKHKTMTLKPAWHEALSLADFLPGDALEFLVFDHDCLTKDDFMGRATLSGEELCARFFEGCLELQDNRAHKGACGKLFVRVFLTWGNLPQ